MLIEPKTYRLNWKQMQKLAERSTGKHLKGIEVVIMDYMIHE